MKIALSSDEHAPIVDFISAYLKKENHEVSYFGPLKDQQAANWPEVTQQAAEQVASQQAAFGICLCWTGTGACIAANKVNGIRAALCHDSETVKGARLWNHANILVLSIRSTSIPLAEEMLKTWLTSPVSKKTWDLKQIAYLHQIEGHFDTD
ncbi:RpiB/LacA/LacB family sugar-phosphate isomerase [uncultured Shewanella sp.]|uniref:RpiB/LacA/LacB family sugar-phosphate isomerase n=1 Tax=uncultured Shewanella sp. TaxID=173975 RepID=UPI0026283239|nr:RpiB/LacA/LacB family sugar-phosphate isomerase [uncultured Shewanella sp.]